MGWLPPDWGGRPLTGVIRDHPPIEWHNSINQVIFLKYFPLICVIYFLPIN